jgi:hypothetical protein
MLFRETVAVYCENQREQTYNTHIYSQILFHRKYITPLLKEQPIYDLLENNRSLGWQPVGHMNRLCAPKVEPYYAKVGTR